MAIKTVLRAEAPATRVASLRGWPGKDLAEADWSKAPCKQPGADLEDWHPVTEVAGINPERIRKRAEQYAREICGDCPLSVSKACLELAVREGDVNGVRGALAEHELRKYVAAERRRRAAAGSAVAA